MMNVIMGVGGGGGKLTASDNRCTARGLPNLGIPLQLSGVSICVDVLVFGWSINEEFGLEFKLSCRE